MPPPRYRKSQMLIWNSLNPRSNNYAGRELHCPGYQMITSQRPLHCDRVGRLSDAARSITPDIGLMTLLGRGSYPISANR
jgi:hypothetical protein